MTQETPLTAAELLEKYRREKAEAALVPEPAKVTDLIPVSAEFADMVPEVYERDDEQARAELLIENTIRSIDPLEAYKKFIGKEIGKQASPGNIYVSCPFPWHRDPEKPDAGPGNTHGLNASLHLETGKWKCFKCEQGGDIFTMASIGFGRGHEVPSGSEFWRLKEEMAESFGTHTKRVDNKTVAWRDDAKFAPPAPQTPAEPEASTTPQAPPAQQAPLAAVPEAPTEVTGTPGQTAADFFAEQAAASGVELPPPTPLHVVPVDYTDDGPADIIKYPTLDWRSICAPDTFLHEYMSATSNDDSPEEYHFWHAMLALGHTVGKNVQINDAPPVNANLMLCLLGGTGFGKSKSRRYLDSILRDVVPFRAEPDRTVGVKAVTIPGSGEHLITQFEYQQRDPVSGKPNGHYVPVNGIVDWDEFSGMISKSKSIGSTLQQTIMKFADCVPEITNGSQTNGDHLAKEPFCSITASTQPRALRAILSRNDQSNGFLNRWVFAGGPRKEREVFGGDHSDIKIDMSRATDQLKLIKGWGAGTKRLLMIDDEALPTIVKFFKTKIEPMIDKDDTEMLQRLNLIYKKILLLLAINQKKNTIDLEIHNRAMPIIDYLVHCYGLVSASIGITAQHELADDVIRYAELHMSRYNKGVTPRELERYLRGKKPAPGALKQTIDFLIALDMLEIEPKMPGPGRPTVRYRKVAV